jgi:ribose transport system substrate-binding protein
MANAMKHSMSMSVLASFSLGMAAACGTGASDIDGGQRTGDAVAQASPFVPLAIEGVVDSLVHALAVSNLPAAGRPPVAVLLKDLTGFWGPVVVGANRMATRLYCPNIVEAPLVLDQSVTEEVKGAQQNAYIQRYLADGIFQGMALAPYATDATSVAYLNTFAQRRGPVVTLDSDSPASARSYLIATANYHAGVTVAHTLAQGLSPGDLVAVFGTTDPTWISGMERAQGAEDGAVAAGLTLAPRIPVVWNADTDLQSIQNAIVTAGGALKGLLCMYSNSYLCAAAVAALGLGGTIRIVGFDLSTETKSYFDQGYFYGIAVQRQYYMGELGVLVPYSINVLGPSATAAALSPILVDGTSIDTGIDIITTANYGEYVAYLSDLGISG